MKVTKSYIKQLVKEELNKMLREGIDHEKKPLNGGELVITLYPNDGIATWKLVYDSQAGAFEKGKIDYNIAGRATPKGGNDPMPAAEYVFKAVQQSGEWVDRYEVNPQILSKIIKLETGNKY